MNDRHRFVTWAVEERTKDIVRRMNEAPSPIPGLEGASMAKMRRTAARLRSGKFRFPATDMTPEQLAEALENTVRWREIREFARSEAVAVVRTIDEICSPAEARVVNDCLAVLHEGRRLAKAQGPDSKIAKTVRAIQRAWRASVGRSRKPKHKRRQVDRDEPASKQTVQPTVGRRGKH